MENVVSGIYKCYNGKMYEVIGEIYNKTVNQVEILYKPIESDRKNEFYTRYKNDFLSSIVSFHDKCEVKMFEKID